MAIVRTEAYVESMCDSELVLRVFTPLRREQRRTDVRLPVEVPVRQTVRLKSGQDGGAIRSRVLDMSAGGVLLRTGCQLQIGERLVLGLTLPGDARELRCALVVRNSRLVGESRFVWDSGCKFRFCGRRTASGSRNVFAQQREAAWRRKAKGLQR